MSNILVKPINPFQERPVWSVIIPHYNRDEYLLQALESVLEQDQGAAKMEIWVVDDCSSLGNPETIVKKNGKGRVNFFRQQENVGQLKNFETCLNLSKGMLIHLLHCDDFVHPGFYEKLEKPLISDKTIGAAFTRHNSVDKENKVLITSEEIIPQPGILENFMLSIAKGQMIQTPSIVVKREVYEKLGGFNKNLKGAEDWEMWVRIACKYRYYYHPEILASYRLHSASNTGNSFKKGLFIDDALACMKIYFTYLPVESSLQKKIFKRAKLNLLKYAFYVSRKFRLEFNDNRTALLILNKSLNLSNNIFSYSEVMFEILKIKLKCLFMAIKDGNTALKQLKGDIN